MKKVVMIGGGLILVFLLVNNATGSGNLIKDTTSGATSVVKAFQGR